MKAQRLRVGNILGALVLIVGAICLLVVWIIQCAGHAVLAAGDDRLHLPDQASLPRPLPPPERHEP